LTQLAWGHREFKYSEDGAMINPPAVHGAVLSSFHLLGGALSFSLIYTANMALNGLILRRRWCAHRSAMRAK
jgi:polyferredoxin